jgi:hypothetical protein
MPAHFFHPERLAVLLSLATHTDAERAEVDALAADPALDWAELDRLCSHNAIRPLAHKHLVAGGHWARVPAAIAEPWAAFSATIAERNHLRLETARPLFTEAAESGIQIAILKGVYFAPTYYHDEGYKKMNDIDFLMHVEDLDRLYALYEKHDYFCLGMLLDDDKQTKFSHHSPPFFHRSLNAVLGTHWGLVSPLTKYRPDYAAMWTRVAPFEFLGAQHFGLHPVDNLHHLAIHLPYYKAGLREIADLYNLLRAEPDFDWALFGAEVKKAGTAELVYHALSLAHALVPMPAVEAYLKGLEPELAGFYYQDTLHRVREPRRILYGRSTHMSEIDKAFGEFTMSDDLVTKLKAYWGMWGNGFFAPRREVARFHYVDEGAWYLPFLYPSMIARVMRYIAKDLGWKIFALVCLKHQIDLWKSLGRTVSGKTRPSELDEAAQRHNLTRDQIQTLRALLE